MDVAAIIGRALDCRQQPNGSHLSCERLARRRKACWTKLRAKLLRDPPRKRGHETDYGANRPFDPGRGELVSASYALYDGGATATPANGDLRP